MLEKQRDRYRPVTEKRSFARNVVLVHLLVGLVVTGLLVFHELFVVSLGVFLWYLISVGLVAGMMKRQEWCRPILGLMFLAMAAGCAVFVTRIHPHLEIDHAPMLSRQGLPLWGTVVTVVYAVCGVMMFISNRLKRATMLGFGFW